MRSFRVAIVFLTRLPLRLEGEVSALETARACRLYPLVGALLGLAGAAIYALAALALPPLPAALLAVAAGVLLTGALHEDALGDVADGFGGGWDPARRLEIMRDPRQGTYGVAAIALSLLLRASALAAIAPSAAWIALPAIGALSRAGMVWMIAARPPARSDGVGARTAAALRPSHAAEAALLAALPGLGLGWLLPAALALCAALTWGLAA
jgi:adenosylcobinamide-GDP ribazoletransferase